MASAKVTALKTATAAPADVKNVTIKPPKFETATVTIRSTAPYIQNRFANYKQEEMVAKQKEGSKMSRTRKAKPPKDFERGYRGSMHIAQEGWHGIPCTALRNAMIDACRLTEIDMIRAKMCIRIIADGLDAENLEPLVRIKGEPRMHLDRVKIGMNQTDIIPRAMFEKWEASITIQWDADVFQAQDVVNLLARAGWQVGVGAGRPLSKTSAGTGKGTFEIVGASEPKQA